MKIFIILAFIQLFSFVWNYKAQNNQKKLKHRAKQINDNDNSTIFYDNQNMTEIKSLKKLVMISSDNEKIQNLIQFSQEVNKNVSRDTKNLDYLIDVTKNLSNVMSDLLQKFDINKDEKNLSFQMNQVSSQQIQDIKKNFTVVIEQLRSQDFVFSDNLSDKQSQNATSNVTTHVELNNQIINEIQDMNIDSQDTFSDDNEDSENVFQVLFSKIEEVQKPKLQEYKQPLGNFSEVLENMKLKLTTQLNQIEIKNNHTDIQNNQTQDLLINNTNSVPENQQLHPLINNKSLDQVLEVGMNINGNFSQEFEKIQIQSQEMSDDNQKNKLRKIDIQNFVNEQIKILTELENTKEKTAKIIQKFSFLKDESNRINKKFKNLNSIQSQEQQQRFLEQDNQILQQQKKQEMVVDFLNKDFY